MIIDIDGVKVNYAKFQGVEVAQEGKKALKVDLLAKLKWHSDWRYMDMAYRIEELQLKNFGMIEMCF